MAVPLAVGGMAAARGLAAYLAKKKATKAALKSDRLVPTQGGLAKRMTNPALAAVPIIGGITAGIMQGGDRVGEGGYMAGPMMGKSQNPSYDASMTREGQIQSLMEQMDGMGLSEEAKKRIIEDKLGPDFTAKDYHIMQEGMNYPVSEFTPEEIMDYKKRNDTGASVTSNEENYFQKRLKEASGAGKFLIDPTGLIRKGGNKALKMFMGRPVETSGYDRGPIRPRYDENGNLIPQRPTMMV